MNNRIFYLGYYDIPQYAEEERNAPPAAVAKMTYIVNALNRIGYRVELVSPAAAQNKKTAKGRRISLDQNNTLKLFYSFGGKNKISALIRFLLLKLSFFFYLLFRVDSSDTVLIYHSAEFIGTVSLLKRVKKFRLVLEVEEIYADVTGKEKVRRKEYGIFKQADAYVFSTELLSEIINPDHQKPETVVYGSYLIPGRQVGKRFDDGKIHCVYAGTFDPRKGVLTAANAARYLPENYHIHLIGFGTKAEVEQLRSTVEAVSAEARATLSYDGLLSGRDYTDFLGKCDIGLSPQAPEASFNETSFPSKTLSYLTNGLRVVSVAIKSLQRSSLHPYLVFFDECTPESIAKAILSVRLSDDHSACEAIKELDKSFCLQLKQILSR